jgi:hypothetical protein
MSDPTETPVVLEAAADEPAAPEPVLEPEPPARGRRQPPGMQTAEHWRDVDTRAYASYKGGFDAEAAYRIAKAHNTWPIGKLLTQAEYHAAIGTALGAPNGAVTRASKGV